MTPQRDSGFLGAPHVWTGSLAFMPSMYFASISRNASSR